MRRKKAVSDNRTALDDGISSNKKYPFNRTTTPNTLREHLKETLAKNLGSSTDLAETIHAIRDREMLLKKKKASEQDLSTAGKTDLDEELGSGLFDRFSKARTTLTRSSVRKKKDEDS